MSSRASKFAALVFGVGICVGSVAQLQAQELERGANAKPETTTATVTSIASGIPSPSNLVQGLNGSFYGTTQTGGSGNPDGGIVFQLSASGTLSTVYNFCSLTNCADGELPVPSAGLIVGSDGNFYGTASGGGTGGNLSTSGGQLSPGGVVFKLTPGGTLTVVYNFCSVPEKSGSTQYCADGNEPYGGVIEGSDGNFYGTTRFGGSVITGADEQTGGTIFKVTPGGTLTTLFAFTNALYDSEAPLVQGSDGKFYGTAVGGGGQGDTGGVFVLSGSTLSVYSFATAVEPGGALVEGSNGNFYGTTNDVLVNGYCGQFETCGSLYEITSGGVITTLQSLTGTANAPAQPEAGMYLAGDGNLYGASVQGGIASNPDCSADAGCGEVYQLTQAGALTDLYGFCTAADCPDGTSPATSLIEASDTHLYGTTGGYGGGGTAYKVVVTPALPLAVQLTLSSGSITNGESATLSWVARNAFSTTMQQCYAFVQNNAVGAGAWSGKQTGTLSGGLYSGSATITPTADGVYTYVLVCGGTETAYATLEVGVVIETTLLPTAAVGTAYSTTVVGAGGTTPYTWSVSAGTLPVGLTLNTSTGVISGKPTAAGISNFTIELTDSASHSTTQALSLTVYTSSIVRITTTSLPPWTVGVAYSTTLAATSGTQPYTWSVVQGSLPAGLALAASTGVISGTPTVAGTSSILFGVKGSGNNTATALLSLTINPVPSVVTTLLPTAAVGTAYSTTIAVTGGTPEYVIFVSTGTLPAGLFLDPYNGVLSGTPTASAVDHIDVEVQDSTGADSAQQPLTLTVYGTTIVRITTTSLPNGTVGTAYTATLAATSGTKPYTWSVYEGELPAGLTLAASTGVISGTPTVAGTSDFFIGVKGAGNNTATAALSITIAQ